MRSVLLLLIAVGCGGKSQQADPAPKAQVELSQGEIERLEVGLTRVEKGMSRAQVFEALGVDLEGLGQLGTGPQTEATTIYVVNDSVGLYLTWDATDSTKPVFLRGRLVERATKQ